jgi:hypothetical protein
MCVPVNCVSWRLTIRQPPHLDVRINDTDPIFYYCSAPGSCVDHHMIGVINQNANETLVVQQAFAANATFQLSPGDPWPSEVASPTSTPTGGAGAAGASSPGGSSSGSGGSGLSSGAIAGVAIGGAAVLILAAALIYLFGRRGGFNTAYRRSMIQPVTPPMVEAKYNPPPKSPGQATFSTYSVPGDNDPYRSLTQSPQNKYFASPPAPLSPGSAPQGYNSYQGTLIPGLNAPLMGEMGAQPGYQ